MTDEPLLLALDQGTTSTRAIAFAADGRTRASAGAALPQGFPGDGWVEHDPERIFADSVAALREVVERAGAPTCLGITNQRETVVVWERATGRPVHPAIVWQDRRTAAECERLKADGAEAQVTDATGLLLDPYFSATKIAWILDHVNGARAAAERGDLLAGTVDSWLIWRLTGGRVHATEPTNASRTLLFDLQAGDWSDDLCRLFGVPRALLPEVRDTAGSFGEVEAGLISTHALSITGVAGDQQAALMGQGGVAEGVVKATYGTGCFLLAHAGDRRPHSQSRLLATAAARLDGRLSYALEGAIFSAGSAVDWAAALLGLNSAGEAARLAETAADTPVVLVPAFTGLGAPWWSSDARGALYNLTRDTGPAEVARAAFDAACWQTLDLLDAVRRDAPDALPEGAELRIDGGMARSRWFAQRLADVTGLAVARAEESEATALGAALFAGLGAGVFASADEAAARRSASERLEPRDPPGPEAAARWRTAVERTIRAG